MNENKVQAGFTDLSAKEEAKLDENPESLLAKAAEEAPKAFTEGTWEGTQMALTKMYNKVEYSYASMMDICDFEPSLPRPYTIEEKRNIFAFSNPADPNDNYPPHLNLGNLKDTNPTASWSEQNPSQTQKATLGPAQIFNQVSGNGREPCRSK